MQPEQENTTSSNQNSAPASLTDSNLGKDGGTPASTSSPTSPSIAPMKTKRNVEKVLMLLVLLLIIAASGAAAYFLMRGDTDKVSGPTVNNTPIERVDVAIDNGSLNSFYPNGSFDGGLYDVMPQIGDTLVRFDSYKVVPALAVSWVNPEENVWEFTLRSDVKFHTGTLMTAEHVKASIEAAKDTEVFGAYVENIKEVTVDQGELRIVTTQPDVLLLKKLTYLTIFDTDASDVADPRYTTGAFTLKPGTEITDKKLELVTFSGYYGTKPTIKNLVFSSYNGQEEVRQAIKDGKIDVLRGGNRGGLEEVALQNGLKTAVLDGQELLLIYLETGEGKLLANQKLRQAISLSIDRQAVIDKLKIKAAPAAQVLTPELPGYDSELPALAHNVEQAKKLLEASGYKGETLKFLYTSEVQTVPQAVIDMIREAGITVEFIDKPVEELFDEWVTGNYDMLSLSYVSDLSDGSDMLRAMIDPEFLEGARYGDATLIEKLSDADTEFNDEKRTDALQVVNKEIHDKSVVVPLFHRQIVCVYNPTLDITPAIVYPTGLSTCGIDFSLMRAK